MKLHFLSLFAILFFVAAFAQEKRNTLYTTNQAPLFAQPYTALPLGAIKPKGFLLKQPDTCLPINPTLNQYLNEKTNLSVPDGWLTSFCGLPERA